MDGTSRSHAEYLGTMRARRWDEAMADFLESSRGSEDMREIALANYAPPRFKAVERTSGRDSRKLLPRPRIFDTRRACRNSLALGDETSAEAEDVSCKLVEVSARNARRGKRDGGALAHDLNLRHPPSSPPNSTRRWDAGLDTRVTHTTTDTVANRWPLRAIAALDAFTRPTVGRSRRLRRRRETFDLLSPRIDA